MSAVTHARPVFEHTASQYACRPQARSRRPEAQRLFDRLCGTCGLLKLMKSQLETMIHHETARHSMKFPPYKHISYHIIIYMNGRKRLDFAETLVTLRLRPFRFLRLACDL